ncbi:hypothetical protein [Mycobacterium sp. D16R24]|uniref:hypothetical protein n=1 Tax=Mycobacterium sp. D16R24 TaxID=1855656 RepID=UPI0011177BD4|nr:hypothetical protein [Mycobacterium sp. D16R24]
MRLQRHPDMPDDYRKLLSKYGPATLAGVLRLLAPDGPPGFNMATETIRYPQPHPEATLWGIFDTGETCWWFPIREHRRWFVVIVGHGKQQLNVSPTEFLLRWNNGELDLPVLSFPPVRRGWSMTPACEKVTLPAVIEIGNRDPLAQLESLIGPPQPRTHDWHEIEGKLGFGLPTDYKRLHDAYGRVHLNGIFVSAPDEVWHLHDMHASVLDDAFEWRRPTGPGGMLLCATTEGRSTVVWDTANDDPDAWPLIVDDGYGRMPGTLTELLVGELTDTGPGLTSFELGDPGEWAWPIWGPDPPWWSR